MIHPTADVSAEAELGEGTRVWHQAQIRARARVGKDCVVGKNVYIGAGVIVGDRCKIENNASLFEGVHLEDGVFVGPHVVFTNDRAPRAVNADGSPKSVDDWMLTGSVVRRGASIAAGAVVLPGVTIGTFALVGAGAVVTRDVPAYALVVGNPARLTGYVCMCARARFSSFEPDAQGRLRCDHCRQERA